MRACDKLTEPVPPLGLRLELVRKSLEELCDLVLARILDGVDEVVALEAQLELADACVERVVEAREEAQVKVLPERNHALQVEGRQVGEQLSHDLVHLRV